jgi:two-component system sensor histidine kinase/response regulator
MVDPASNPRGAAAAPKFAPAIGLREVLEAAPDLIFCCDASGRFAWASSTFEYFAGWRASDLVGQSFTTLVPDTDRQRVARFFLRQLRRTVPQTVGDFVLLRRDGTRADVTARVRLYERPDGDRYFVGVARERQAPGVQTRELIAERDAALHQARMAELQRQLDESRDAERLKGEVIATLGEQLRGPMDTVVATSNALSSQPLDPESRRLVEQIRGAGQQLISLVSDAHDHAQLEAGLVELDRIGFDLRVTLEQVSAVLAPLAEARNVALDLRVDALVPSRLKGDPGRLRQVLLNLAGNAIRFSDGAPISVRIERDTEDDSRVCVRFRVTDASHGPAADRRGKLFSQDPPPASVVPAGTDLGLAISRRLVHLMGGTLGTDRTGNTGEFWFRVTFEKQAALVAGPSHEDVRLRGMRVLVADNPSPERNEHVSMLEAWGCEVVTADNGIEALEAVRAAMTRGEAHAVVLMDMNLEGLDGMSLAAAIRADHELDALVLVLTTRLGRPGDAQRARELGISGYLVLPLKHSQMFDLLAELVANRHAEREPAGRELVTRHSLAEARRARVRILLVEDDAVNQLVIVSALNRAGYQVEVCSSGRDAIARTESEHWNLVLMDLQIPGMDGLRACAAIRARERGGVHTPIVGLSASGDAAGERDRCIAAGMDDTFPKPIDLTALAAAVQRWAVRDDARAEHEAADSPSPKRTPAALTVVSSRFEAPGGEAPRAKAEPTLPLPELPEGPAIDVEQLNQSSMGLPALRSSMLNTYVSDVYPRLQRLEDAVKGRDLERVEFESHALRGMCLTIGAKPCAVLFGEMESRARAKHFADVEPLLPLAIEQVRRSEEFVQRLERISAREAA